MTIKLALSGANGRMGKAILKAIDLDPTLKVEVKLVKNFAFKLTAALRTVDLLLDFSSPIATMEYLKYCVKLKLPMVIGTTGFNSNQITRINRAAKKIPILLAPNMSIGINICQYLLAFLTKHWSLKLLNNFSDINNTKITLIETHHKLKKDQPSGTALLLAKLIEKNLILSEQVKPPLTIISKRIGKVVGKHQISFSNDNEEIKLAHEAKNRLVFAQGALLATKWLLRQKASKLYDFLDVINTGFDG